MTQKTKRKSALAPNKSVGYQVRKAHRAFDRLLNYHLSPQKLKSGYWYYLRALWIQDGITQRELSEAINVMETTTVSMISGMEKAGLVRRERDAKDKRKLKIFLTEKARTMEEELIHIAINVNSVATKNISKSEISTFLKILEKMNKNLDEV